MIAKVASIILGVLVAGMVVLLCLFSCIVSSISDNYWEEKKEELEKNDERH